MVLVLASAWAADLKLFTPDAPARAGVRTTLELAVADEKGPVHGATIELAPRRGRLLSAVTELAPGRYRASWVAPPGVDEEVFQVHVGKAGPYELHLPVVATSAPSLGTPREQEITAGATRWELRFPSSAPPAPQDVVVRASEGEVVDVVQEPDALRVVVELAAGKDARLVYVGVWDRRTPDRVPVWATARLRMRHTGTVAVEPGSQVTVRIGGRSYGPFKADEQGAAPITFEALPGEGTYEVVATDTAGNSSRVTSPLGGDLGRPVIVALEAGEADRASVYLAAWTATGAPWASSAPVCRSGPDDRGVTVATGRGQWRYDIDAVRSIAMFDLRVECVVGDVALPLRLPVASAVPERIELRTFPDALDADFPIAQVQATLIDARGDRLPPVGLSVSAEHGSLQLGVSGDTLRGEYQGKDAVPLGGDVLRAAWFPPTGRGSPWRIDVDAESAGGGVDIRARLLDRDGRPIGGAPATVGCGAITQEVNADVAGWVSLHLDEPIGRMDLVRVQSGSAEATAVVFGGVDVALPDPSAPDLVATTELRLRAGRVRTVIVEGPTEPVLTGTDDSAPIRVRLLDAAGNPVVDEVVKVDVDFGSISGLTPLGDGRWTAQYRPPPGLADREVAVTVSAAGASGSATVRLQPRPVRGGVSASVGWVTNFGAVSSPSASLRADFRLPFLSTLSARIGASLYQVDAEVTSADLADPVAVRANFYPIELGVVAMQRWTRWSAGGGIAAALVPYALNTQYGEDTGISAPGVGPPGIQLTAEGARRFGMSEIFLDARFLVFPSPTGAVSFDGTVGGLTVGAGYRVLY